MLIKTYRLRLYFLYLIPFALMVGLVVRLYFVQVVNKDFYQRRADAQHFEKYSIIPMRGKIYDSEGHELAGSVVLDKAHLQLHQLPKDAEKQAKLLPELAQGLARVLNDPTMQFDELLRRLKGSVNKNPFIGRDITEEKKVALRDELAKYKDFGLPLSFIHFEPENKRRYSRGGLAPHVVGFTGWNAKAKTVAGQEGVERAYDEELRGREEEYIARRTAANMPMEPADPELLESTFGHSVKLTINESIQTVTQNVLQQGVEKSISDAGVAVCYSVKTGEILAMASYPTFNLNNLKTSPEQRVNRAISHAIEPGSVMKIITFTSLFNDRKLEPFDMINCEGKSWRMPNGRLVVDSHGMGTVPVSEVFKYSSNIGTIKAARAFDPATFYDHLVKFGFGAPTGIDLPSESYGVLKHYKTWSGLSMSSLPMGYEIQLTAVQVVAAVGAIANKGNYMQPHVVKEILDHNGKTVEKIQPKFLRSVADPVACRKIMELMELVVEQGTAKPAKLEGYRVGGKTGTTKKLVNGRYEKAYIASFCGVAPIEDPEVCIYVYIDNPKGSQVYGGSVAAPVFREIAREAMKVLRVPERRPTMPADEFKKTLEKVRNQIEGRVPMEMINEMAEPGSEEFSPGVVPDLKNRTLAEAVKLAAAAGLELRNTGSGTVVSQDPAAYETIEGERVVHVVMENSEEVIGRTVADVAGSLNLADADLESTPVTTSAAPASSVPLMLDLNGKRIPVPMREHASGAVAGAKLPGESSKGALGTLPQPAASAGAGEPGGSSLLTAGLTGRAPKEVGMQETQEIVSSNAPTGPVPEFDGFDDIDPTKQTIVPLDIVTPVKPKRPATEEESGSSEGISLYNL